jgi:rare lipoprotein A (peptidoglycan hydrolase)
LWHLARIFHYMTGMTGWGGLSTLAVSLVSALTMGAAAPSMPLQPYRNSPVQVGLASYYGPGFQGEKTASGEIFDARELVAAHRTLPLGSVVRVTNLRNGRSVVLRVIDRGPYGRNHRKGCIIDVSTEAARKMRFVHDGLTFVRVKVLRFGAPDSADGRGSR